MAYGVRSSALGVLDVQRRLLGWFGTPTAKLFLQGFAESERAAQKSSRLTHNGDWLAAMLPRAVNTTPFYITADMTALAQHASKSMETIGPLHPSDPITSAGFMYLAEPIITLDVNGLPVNTRAISWMPCQAPANVDKSLRGVFVAWYSDAFDMRDDALAKIETERPGILRSFHTDLILLHYGPLWFNEQMSMWDQIRDTTSDQPTGNLAFLLAAWALMKQRIAVTDSVDADRHLRRRCERAGMAEPNTVKVVTLRRPRRVESETPDGYEPAAGNWSHRWIVNGFWRWQWYPSEERHRQIWIAPYVKGPDDKPLVVKREVYEWKR